MSEVPLHGPFDQGPMGQRKPLTQGTYPESYITKYTSIRRQKSNRAVISSSLQTQINSDLEAGEGEGSGLELDQPRNVPSIVKILGFTS